LLELLQSSTIKPFSSSFWIDKCVVIVSWHDEVRDFQEINYLQLWGEEESPPLIEWTGEDTHPTKQFGIFLRMELP